MSLLARAERKFGRFAIPGLIRWVVGGMVVAYVLKIFYPNSMDFWELKPEFVRQGEVWRLFTYIFVPQFASPLGMLFFVWFQFWVGDGLEQVWGAFRLNVYFVLGMIGTTVAAFFFGEFSPSVVIFSSLFFAFARFFGDMVIYVLFILPMKIKWMAWISAALLCQTFIFGGTQGQMAILFGFANYLIFFGKDIIQDARFRHAVHNRRVKFQADMQAGTDETMHRCKICGCTEVSHPDQTFRVTSDGEEYCGDHLPARPAR